MSTQYYTASTLDGFIASTDDSLDWLFRLGDPVESSYPEFIKGVGAIAMGSATYEWLWRQLRGPQVDPAEPWPYAIPAWVFSSRTPPVFPDADIHFVSGDVRPVHQAMVAAAGGKNVWLAGGGDLVGQFHDQGLLDEIFVQIGSATLGSGKPLLPRMISAPSLELVSVRAMGNGFAELRYRVHHSAEAKNTDGTMVQEPPPAAPPTSHPHFHNLHDPAGGIERTLAPGIVARIFAGDAAMCSVATLEPNAKGTLHQHPEEQWGVLLEGDAIRIQDGVHHPVRAGDFWCTPGGVPHTLWAGPRGAKVLDIFAPPREEYRGGGSGFGGQPSGSVG